LLSAHHGAERFEDAYGMLLNLSPAENEETELLFKSQNIEDMISKIKNDDLREALESAVGEYRFLDLVYPLIIAVDQYYYDKLCKELSKLTGEDRTKTKMFFGARIGIQNIEIILRSKTFNIAPSMIKKWLIATKFCPLRTELRDKLIAAPDFKSAFTILRDESPFRDLALRLLDNLEQEKPPLENFDRYADQIIIHRANSIFRGASFNVSIFPAFFFLKEMEIRNIRVIILGKIHKRSLNEILDKIVLV
ncbi:MAG: V-type ATPase subunit, partial [Candidatus Heimdallarchaeota archaeon]